MATKKKQSRVDRWWDKKSPYRRAKRAAKRKIEAKKRAAKKAIKKAIFGECQQCHKPKVPFHTCRAKTDFKKRLAASKK